MAALIDRGPRNPLSSLYVHVPYCTDRCTYCAFPTVANRPGEHVAFVEAVVRELQRTAPTSWSTVYLGGGTPGLLPLPLLSKLLDAIRARGIERSAEITLEANPIDVSLDRLAGWSELGITRLSVGVQTFADNTLRELGRHHDGAQARDALGIVSADWSGSWSADLLVGWRGQDIDCLQRDEAALLEFHPPHISIYALTVEPGAALFAESLLGSKVTLSSSYLDHFDTVGSLVLEAAGYDRYEVSNFAARGHRSRHNQVYWQNGSYLGLGPGASSSVSPLRWSNVREPRAYIHAMATGLSARNFVERVSPIHRLMESLAVGLRTAAGVSTEELDRRFSPAWRELVRRGGSQLIDAGFLSWTNASLTIPTEHLVKTDRIVTEFVHQLDANAAPSQVAPHGRQEADTSPGPP